MIVTSALLAGDSNSANVMPTAGSITAIVDNGDGTATITFAAAHRFAVGHPIIVNNAGARKFNVFGGIVTAQQNSNPYTVTYTLGGRTSPLVTANNAAVAYYASSLSNTGFAMWLQALQRRSLRYTYACAGGTDSGQILTMYDDALAEAQAKGLSDVIVMAGTNDIYARGWDFSTVRASLKALIDRIVATSGARVWWLTVPPKTSADSSWSAAKQLVHNRINRWAMRYAAQVGAVCIDTWRSKAQNPAATVVNAAATNPDYTSLFSSDNTHTTNVAALAIARDVDAGMRQVCAASAECLGAHAALHATNNAAPNPQLMGSSGTVVLGPGGTGTAPDDWTVEVTAGAGALDVTSPARTVAADGDAAGRNLQIVPKTAAVTWRVKSTASLHTAVAAGEVRELSWPLTITGAVGLTGLELIVFGNNSSTGAQNIGVMTPSVAMSGDFSGVLRFPEWTVPAGMTSLMIFLRVTQTGVPGGTFVLGKPSFDLIE